ALAAATLAPAVTRASRACAPKVTIVGGKQQTTYCGPAKATVHYDGKTIAYAGGTCSEASGFFSLYIGTRIAGGSSKHLFYAFGSVRKDGTYSPKDFVDGFQLARGSYSLHT